MAITNYVEIKDKTELETVPDDATAIWVLIQDMNETTLSTQMKKVALETAIGSAIDATARSDAAAAQATADAALVAANDLDDLASASTARVNLGLVIGTDVASQAAVVSAQATAGTAQATADTAQATADTANSNADDAIAASVTAQGTADTAVTNAQTAFNRISLVTGKIYATDYDVVDDPGLGTDNRAALQAMFDAAAAVDVTWPARVMVVIPPGIYPFISTAANPLTCPEKVDIDMRGARLVNYGTDYTCPVLTIGDEDASNELGRYLGINVKGASSLPTLLTPEIMESWIGVKFWNAKRCLIDKIDVENAGIGVQYKAGTVHSVSNNTHTGGILRVVKIGVDLRCTVTTGGGGWNNESNFQDLNLSFTSTSYRMGSCVGVRFSADQGGDRSQNCHRFVNTTFQVGNRSATYVLSGTSGTATAGSYYCGTNDQEYYCSTGGAYTSTPTHTQGTVTYGTAAFRHIGPYFRSPVYHDGCGTKNIFTGSRWESSYGPFAMCRHIPSTEDLFLLYGQTAVVGEKYTNPIVQRTYTCVIAGGTIPNTIPSTATQATTHNHSTLTTGTALTLDATYFNAVNGHAYKVTAQSGDNRIYSLPTGTSAGTEVIDGQDITWQYSLLDANGNAFSYTTYNQSYVLDNYYEAYAIDQITSNPKISPAVDIFSCNKHFLRQHGGGNFQTFDGKAITVPYVAINNIHKRAIKAGNTLAIHGMQFIKQSTNAMAQYANNASNSYVFMKDGIWIKTNTGDVMAPCLLIEPTAEHSRFYVRRLYNGVIDTDMDIGRLVLFGLDEDFSKFDIDPWDGNEYHDMFCSLDGATASGYDRIIAGGTTTNASFFGVSIPSDVKYLAFGSNEQSYLSGLSVKAFSDGLNDQEPMRVFTRWQAKLNSGNRFAYGTPDGGYFDRMGEQIDNLNTASSQPKFFTVKTAGGLFPAWSSAASVRKYEMRTCNTTEIWYVSDGSFTKSAPTASCGTDEPSDEGSGIHVDNAGITWTKTTMAVAVIEASDDLWA